MEHNILVFILALISTTIAVPWVVLDTRSDMLAMSSEVQDEAVMTHTLSLQAGTTLGSINHDETVTSLATETLVLANDDDDNAPDTVPENSVKLEQLAELSAEEQDSVQTTPLIMDKDISDHTTTKIPVSSLRPVADKISNANMNFTVISDTPYSPTRQNPNSIEEEKTMTSVIVVSKKKQSLFSGKKSKFTM